MSRTAFVRKFWPLASVVGEQWGLNPVSILAHALKEAGANNPRAAARHNYFGFLRAGKHLVYSSDEAGFAAYAKRLNTAFPQIVEAGGNAVSFSRAVAYSANPTYVNEPAAKKAEYADTLRKIYKAVASDVQQLGLRNGAIAGLYDFISTQGRTLSKKNDGAACIKNLCDYDRNTHRLLVRTQIASLALARKGVRMTTMDKRLAVLANSYNARQKRVRASRLLKVQAGVSADVQALMTKLKSFISGIGAAPLAVLVPVAVLSLAGLSYLVYNAFFRDEVQAQKDNNEAAHLDKTYQSMSPEEQKFDDDRAAKSYDTGFQAGQKDGGLFDGLKDNMLLVGGAFLLINYFSNKKK